MKRSMITLAAAALALGVGVSAALAQDSTSTAPQSQPNSMTSPTTESTPKATHHRTHTKRAHGMKMAKVDLNSASKEDLTKVPGITDEVAEKIIAARPIASGTELRKKGVVTKAEWSKIRSHVTIKKAS